MSELVVLTGRGLSGLLAGVFLAYAVSVMPALRSMDDQTFVVVMNRVNVVIVNPVFMVVLLGAPLAALALLGWARTSWSVAAALLGVLTCTVTIVFNVPLNDMLAQGGARGDFENSWTFWNIVRTLGASASFLCLLRV